MAPHSITLAWRIPWTEEPGRLQSMGSLELDTTERLHFHFSLSCIGEGNGNPLQCSCLENPRDGGAWWAAVCGVAQSQTRLKRLSSSSSSSSFCKTKRFSYMYTYIPFLLVLPPTSILQTHYFRSPQNPELSSLCYITGCHWPSVLYMVCIYVSPSLLIHSPLPIMSTCPFSMFVSLFIP